MKKSKKRGAKTKKTKTIVLSLGGSIIAPGLVDINFLKKFRNFILNRIKNKNERFIIICGGGKTAGSYIDAAKSLGSKSHLDQDMIGIRATRLNAELVRVIFGTDSYKDTVPDYNKKVSFKKTIIGCGFKPGVSTDTDAVKYATNHKAKIVINMSNITHAYTKDPRKFKNAAKIENISWKDFRKIVGNVFKPRMNAPFDPIASRIAQQKKIDVVILNGKNLKNLGNFLNGKKFIGTYIHS